MKKEISYALRYEELVPFNRKRGSEPYSMPRFVSAFATHTRYFLDTCRAVVREIANTVKDLL